MKKTALKLIPAVAMLLVSAIMVSTATFAWFSMNTTVEASGMQLTAVTPVNLLISEKTSGWTDADWGNSVDFSGVSVGKLYPSSTDDAVNFNAITNSGNYIGSGAGGVAENSTAFQATSAVTASSAVAAETGYYATYTFALKLSERQVNPAKVYLSNLTVTKNAEDTNDLTPAVRFAVFSGNAVDALSLKRIYATNGAAASYTAVGGSSIAEGTLYSAIDPGDKVTMTASDDADPLTNYRKAAASTGNITYDESDKIEVNETAVLVKVVIWVEGQDPACNNTVTGHGFDITFDFSTYEEA